MKLRNLTAGILCTTLASTLALADTAVPASTVAMDSNKLAVEKIVHDYLLSHPEILLEASQELQKKQQVALQKEAKSAILQNSEQLLKGSLAVAGNPKGNVTLVEFFDYQCGHCVQMKPIVNSLIKKDPNLRVVYREFPIFGKSSETASRVALAAAMQGKYLPLQDALFGMGKQLDEASVLAAAKAAGVDMTKLQADMQSKTVSDSLNENRQLAEKMHLMGTPAFIVLSTPEGAFKSGSEPTFVPGAASEEALQDMISKAAKS